MSDILVNAVDRLAWRKTFASSAIRSPDDYSSKGTDDGDDDHVIIKVQYLNVDISPRYISVEMNKFLSSTKLSHVNVYVVMASYAASTLVNL